jgi:hypothetical protein
MHAKILSRRSLKYQAKLPMNHQSGEEGIRHHCATENHSPIGLKTASESLRKYALTRGHGFKYLRHFKNRQRSYDRKIKLLSELKRR